MYQKIIEIYHFLLLCILFSGDAVIQYTLNVSVSSGGKLFLFLSEDWREITDKTSCLEKFDLARASCMFTINLVLSLLILL